MTSTTTVSTTTDSLNNCTQARPKVLYIVRGISGSGKSTLSKQLTSAGGAIFSTDDFFVNEQGHYVFNPTQLGNAHAWNQNRVKDALRDGVSPVVVDNTNTQRWEAKPYVQMALHHMYEVVVTEPDTPWKCNAQELARRNTHGVPVEAIQRMLDRWETDFSVDAIMASQPPQRRGGPRKPQGNNRRRDYRHQRR